MAKPLHEQMLDEGAKMAPEPETAEQRTNRGRKRAVGGAVAGGGAAALKFGGLTKLAAFLFVFHGFAVGWIGGWLAIVLILAVSFGLHYLRATRSDR
jgi:hypothetical protein